MTEILKENLQWKQSFNWTEVEQVGAFHLMWDSFLNIYFEKAYSCCLSTKLDYCFDATHFYAPLEQKWKLSIISLAIQVYAHLHSNLYKNLFHTSLLGGETNDRKHMSLPDPVSYNSPFLLSGKKFHFVLYSKNRGKKSSNTKHIQCSCQCQTSALEDFLVTRNQKLLFSSSPACRSFCFNKREKNLKSGTFCKCANHASHWQ